MNYTEQQIIEKAHQIMKYVDGKYYSENCVKDSIFHDKHALISPKFEEEIHPTWIIGIKSLFDNEDLLYISDETGEPLYYQNFNTLVFDIEKNEEGEYFLVGIDLD